MRRAGKHILIIPEGWCEYNYAQALKASLPRDKQRSISVEMPKPNSENKALQLLGKAQTMLKKATRDKNPFDAIWIFFDNDNQPNLAQYFNRLNNSIRIAYSSICFEHWLIIHLENNRRSHPTADHALQRIEILWRNQFNQEYDKTQINHFEKLKNFIPIAIERANSIKKQAEADQIPMAERNPYFTIQDFVQYFQAL